MWVFVLFPPGSRLDLQLLPISFLVTNGKFEKSLLEPPSLEHEALFRELALSVKHALSSYSSLLQVTIQDCLNDSFICVGELLFQAPGPKPQNLLQTLQKAVDSEGHLADSQFQVDPSSFFIAEENLKFSPGSKTMSSTSVAIIMLSLLSVFIGFSLIILCVRCRLHYWHQGMFLFPQVHQMHGDMLELHSPHECSGQQDESPDLGSENPGFTLQEESESSI
ncbi:uncharacterized protein LOC122744023 [Dromiciops gliroides]|uniref:uncharacterized protein LOC122744023 n=1 Tax=Dromiciops gliroides TaxID=33562 RepID=UPI001CC5DC93|nr:uncharacterized protein LOC122744023 [Dromiciops gliroides]